MRWHSARGPPLQCALVARTSESICLLPPFSGRGCARFQRQPTRRPMTRAEQHRASHHQLVGARASGWTLLPLDMRRRLIITTLVALTCAMSQSVATTPVNAEGAGALPAAGASAPEDPPAQICGNAAVLNGPATAPAGAVVVSAGTNSVTDATYRSPPGTTFWLAPGAHLLGSGGDVYSQVIPKDGNRYIGAPGAILDGQNVARYAFTRNRQRT